MIVQTESLIRSDERAIIKKRIEKIIDDSNLRNLHSKNCWKNIADTPIEHFCDCDVAEFLTAVVG